MWIPCIACVISWLHIMRLNVGTCSNDRVPHWVGTCSKLLYRHNMHAAPVEYRNQFCIESHIGLAHVPNCFTDLYNMHAAPVEYRNQFCIVGVKVYWEGWTKTTKINKARIHTIYYNMEPDIGGPSQAPPFGLLGGPVAPWPPQFLLHCALIHNLPCTYIYSCKEESIFMISRYSIDDPTLRFQTHYSTFPAGDSLSTV